MNLEMKLYFPFTGCFLITWFISVKSERWPYDKSPEELTEEVLSFRKELDNSVGLNKHDKCDDTTPYYQKYTKLNEYLLAKPKGKDLTKKRPKENEKDPEITIFRELMAKYEELKNDLKERKEQLQFCQISKGMICGPGKTCICKENYDSHPIAPTSEEGLPEKYTLNVYYNRAIKSCFLQEHSTCRAEWETKCEPKAQCVAEKGSVLKDIGKGITIERGQPEKFLICNQQNLRKYEIEDKWSCSCEVPFNTKIEKLKKLSSDLKEKVTKLNHGESCNIQFHDILDTVDTATRLKEESSIQKLYRILMNQVYANLDEGVIKDTLKVCERTDKNKMKCDENSKCACLYGASYTEDKVCILRSQSKCDSDKVPYECPSDERCLFDYDNTKVLCSEENLKDIKYLQFPSNSSKKVGCKCQSGEFANRFSAKELKDLEELSRQQLTQDVQDLANNSAWKLIGKGERCEWTTDRRYFELQDFLRAGLGHVFFASRPYLDLKTVLRRASTNTAPLNLCNTNETSLRCSFITGKCDCPMDGWLRENIPSVWNETAGKCFLKKNSLCHPTLTEWIRCPDHQQCLYDEISVLCNRENKNSIVKKGMHLKSAMCHCSDKTPQEVGEKLGKKVAHDHTGHHKEL